MSDQTPPVQSQSKQGRRPRWVCRLFGHVYREPRSGWAIDFYIPGETPIGVCRCGARWERQPAKVGGRA